MSRAMTTIQGQRPSWAAYAMALARTAAIRSEDPYVQVGTALLRHDNSVASLGYNGAPPGLEIDWSDRGARRPYVIHAEANALRYVRPEEVALLATTVMPCDRCLLLASAYKISRVVFAGDLDPAHYDIDFIVGLAEDLGIEMIRESEVQ